MFFNTGYSLVWVKKQKPIVHFLDRIEHMAVMPLMYREGELEVEDDPTEEIIAV